MSQATRTWAALAVGLSLTPSPRAEAQPPAAPAPPRLATELPPLVQRLADQLRGLADSMAAQPPSPPTTSLGPDPRELVQSLEELRAIQAAGADRYQLLRAYSGIDASLHYLLASVLPPNTPAQAVARDVSPVVETDAQIHRLLSLNALPPNYYAKGSVPVGLAQTQRLARALVDRAETLAAVVAADMPGPAGARAVQATSLLVPAADSFHDSIDPNGGLNIARQGFAGVVASTKQVKREVTVNPTTPRVRRAWRAYQAVEVLLRENLGLPIDPEDLPGTALPAKGRSPIMGLADQLVGQATAFVEAFTPTAGTAADGRAILADAQRLRETSVAFRGEAQRGVPPNQLAFEFREVDVAWQRLARRANRLSPGKPDPSRQQVDKLGVICAQIHELLGLPGFYPELRGGVPPAD